MDNFYITLTSNVENEFFENTVANFKTKLATPIKLDGNWQVGLASISYTKSWKPKINKADFHVVYYKHMYWIGHPENVIDDSFVLKLNEFSKVEDIVDEINLLLTKKENDFTLFPLPRLKFNALTNRVEMNLTSYESTLIVLNFSENLCWVLGYDKKKLDEFIWNTYDSYKKEYYNQDRTIRISNEWNRIKWTPREPKKEELKIIADKSYNTIPTFSSLYVYCDIVKHSFVGDSYSQLIRFVEVPSNSKFRDQLLFSYTNIHYINLYSKEFDSIEIDIKDDFGERIPFLFGRTLLTLHFKRV